MIEYKYYKFPSQGDVPNDDEWPIGVNVDQIGKIIDQPGTYDEEGNELTSPTYLDGWHVNVCYQNGADLSFIQEYEIQVNSPVRVWFGQPI